MNYDVIITDDAETDLERFIQYLLFEKQSIQAATNLLDDFEETIAMLSVVAGSLKLCENDRLKIHGYRRINFMKHNYFMLYRIRDNQAIVDALFHNLQDYENKMQ